MAFSLQSFHEQRMPFVLRLLWCILLLPCPEMMKVIRQHLVASAEVADEMDSSAMIGQIIQRLAHEIDENNA